MRAGMVLRHEFVEYIPDTLQEGTIYVSIGFATAAHKCCCGCGHEVITPISPTDWKLVFDGESVSLHPSIGNWSFPCRSHYWIRRDRVTWARPWSQEEVLARRAHEALFKDYYSGSTPTPSMPGGSEDVDPPGGDERRDGIWQRLQNRFRRLWSAKAW